ncbi:hypothetical protein E3E35_11210, partial [Thermococcus sp. GR7]|uniref:hypothetical protein n=2 Tax=Thermococcus TaxID=2263 RepID=UPI001430748B
MDLSNGLAALSAYGVLLIVNNQIAKFVEEHPRKAHTSLESFIKWSLIFLFSTFTGLNLAFAKVLGYIWSSG